MLEPTLFYKAGFDTAGQTQQDIGFRFYYCTGDILVCRVLCPVIYQQKLEPMLRASGASWAGNNEDGTVVHYDMTTRQDLRSAISMQQSLISSYVTRLGPVVYEYAINEQTNHGIRFIEVHRGLFQIIVTLTCPTDKIVLWCREARATGLVADIRANGRDDKFLVTLTPGAHQTAHRLQTYESLARPFNDLVNRERSE